MSVMARAKKPKANKEDRSLPNWGKTQEVYEREGWLMEMDDNGLPDPLRWRNVNTGEEIP